MPPSRYYTGQRVDSNVLEPSQAINFVRFVQNHLHAPVRVNLTRSAFRSSTKEQQKSHKKVGYFVPGVIPTCERKQVNVTAVNLICLDVDNSRDAAPFVANPDLLATQLAPFNFAAYTTISSTPEAPRIRIVVDAEAVPPGLYDPAVRTIAARLGLTEVTTESLLPHQPMFLPSVFTDTDPDTEHPVFASHFDGRPFTPADLGEINNDTLQTAPRPRNTGGASEPSIDDLAFLRAPVEGITLEMARDALSYLDSSCDYWGWLDVSFALKHQFGGTDQDGEAYDLFHEWSEGGKNFVDEKDTMAKWRSSSVHPEGRAPVTIRTLIKRASAAGWKGAEEAARITTATVETWFLSASELELETEGPKRIAALPLLNKVTENRLTNMLVKHLKDRFEITVKASVIEKEVKKARVLMNPQTVPKEKQWPPWAQGICYVQTSCEFYHIGKSERYSREAFDASYGRFMEKDDEGKSAKPSDFLLHTLQCRTPYDFTYDPAQTEPYVTFDGHEYVNRYSTKGCPTAAEEGSEEAGALFLHHLHKIIKEPEYIRVVMDWIAHNIQFPGRKIRFAVLIQGFMGGGKGFIGETMRVLLGNGNVRIVELDSVKGGFSEWSTGAQVVVIDEVFIAGQNRHEIMNKLKPLITNDYIGVTEKFKNARTERNVTNYFVMTNHKGAIAISNGERRYYVIESSIQTEAQALALDTDGYFEKLFELHTNTAKLSALRYFFENWQISENFKPNGRAPKTKYFDSLVQDCASDDTAAIRQIIEDGDDPLIQHDLIGINNLQGRLEVEGIRLTGQRIGHILRAENYQKVETRIMLDGQRQLYYRKAGFLNGTTDIAAVVRQRAKVPELVEV